jgi:hypothetical protein
MPLRSVHCHLPSRPEYMMIPRTRQTNIGDRSNRESEGSLVRHLVHQTSLSKTAPLGLSAIQAKRATPLPAPVFTPEHSHAAIGRSPSRLVVVQHPTLSTSKLLLSHQLTLGKILTGHQCRNLDAKARLFFAPQTPLNIACPPFSIWITNTEFLCQGSTLASRIYVEFLSNQR